MKNWPPSLPEWPPSWPFGKDSKKLPPADEEEEGVLVDDQKNPESIDQPKEPEEETSGDLLADDPDEQDEILPSDLSIDDEFDDFHKPTKSSNVLTSIVYHVLASAVIIVAILLSSAAVFHLARLINLPPNVAEISGIITAASLTLVAIWRLFFPR